MLELADSANGVPAVTDAASLLFLLHAAPFTGIAKTISTFSSAGRAYATVPGQFVLASVDTFILSLCKDIWTVESFGLLRTL